MRIDTSLFYHLVIIDGLSKAVAPPRDFKGFILDLSVNQFGHFTLIYDKMFKPMLLLCVIEQDTLFQEDPSLHSWKIVDGT